MNNRIIIIAVTFLLSLCTLSLNAFAVEVGNTIPDFSIRNQDGKSVSQNDLKGKFTLLYWYPKDDTPGCTVEAQKLSAKHPEFQKLNGQIFGLSIQGAESHRAFKKKHNIPFDLLVDEDAKLAKQFGIGIMPLMGFAKRSSLLVGPDLKVIKKYTDVNPNNHADEAFNDLQDAQPKTSSK